MSLLVGVQVDREQAEEAVRELRLFISLYEGVELPPESRIARHPGGSSEGRRRLRAGRAGARGTHRV